MSGPDKFILIITAMLLTAIVLVVFSHTIWSAPLTIEGNPTCSTVNLEHIVKVDPPISGTYQGISVQFTGDGRYVDWQGDNVDLVLVKGGPNSYAHRGVDMVGRLRAPDNRGGQTPEISHVTFCKGIPQMALVEGDDPTPSNPTPNSQIPTVLDRGRVQDAPIPTSVPWSEIGTPLVLPRTGTGGLLSR